ncbi:hypothetical protein ACE017_02615 [Shewanella mangrovisoli]
MTGTWSPFLKAGMALKEEMAEWSLFHREVMASKGETVEWLQFQKVGTV